MWYSLVIYGWYVVGVAVGSTEIGNDQADNYLLQTRDQVDHYSFTIYPRSPVDRPPSRGRGQSQSSTPVRDGNSPQTGGSKNQVNALHGVPRTPQVGTPQPQGRPLSRGTPQSQGTPRSHSSELIPGSTGRGQTPSPRSSHYREGGQTASSHSNQYGGRGQSWGRGQGYYSGQSHHGGQIQNDPRAHQLHTPIDYRGGHDPYLGNQYGDLTHRGYPVNRAILEHRRRVAIANSPVHNNLAQHIPPTSAETFANGPGKYYAHGGAGSYANMYLGAGERGSKGAEHDKASYGGGETTQGGRVITRVTGQKVQSRVNPRPGGAAQISYQTPVGLATSNFVHPAKGQIRMSSSNGVPVTLHTQIVGPSDVYSMARNSPPRRDQ